MKKLTKIIAATVMCVGLAATPAKAWYGGWGGYGYGYGGYGAAIGIVAGAGLIGGLLGGGYGYGYGYAPVYGYGAPVYIPQCWNQYSYDQWGRRFIQRVCN